MKNLLSLAGFDPTSGAGVSLDIKAFELLGFHGTAVLTSLTSQNTKEVKKIHCLPPDFIWEQFQTLAKDLPLSGIKVGMIGCKKNIPIVKKILASNPHIPRVVDPVFKSSSGEWLLEKEAIPSYISELSEKASLLTPNLAEAQMIIKAKIESIEDTKNAAKKIWSHIKTPCLITGGCFKNRKVDVLYEGKTFHFFERKKIKKKVHGTGCFLSSSILGYMANDQPLEKACLLANQLTWKVIKEAVQIGRGQHIIFLSKAHRNNEHLR